MKKTELLLILFLSIIIIGVRVYKLDADPPHGLSISSDVYTDPPNLTLHAKQKINNNKIDSTIDNKYIFFINSSITVVAKIVYSISKVSLTSSNMIGLFFSLGGLFLFFFITRKAAGALAGIAYLCIIGLNYNQLFYGRLAFQEHSMIFWGALAFVLLLYFDNKFTSLLAGISLGCCIFFGKMIGVVFIIPFTIYLFYELYIQKNSTTKLKGISFFSGLLSLTIFWGIFVYYPMLENVHSYINEQVYNNHGLPLAFKSVNKFFDTYITFGHISHLVSRMVIVCLLASFYIIAVLYNITPLQKKNYSNFNKISIHLFIVSLIIAFYLFLMIWEYRPLRYQLVLIYPLCTAAAIFISYVWNNNFMLFKKNRYKLFSLLLPITILYSSFIVFKYNDSILKNSSYETKIQIIFLGMVVFAFLLFISIKLWINWNSGLKKNINKIFVLLSLLFIVSMNSYKYYEWAVRPVFTVRDNSYDLQNILEPNAFITGSYASTLTIETKYNSIIHMFGVSEPDPNFFKHNPITHLLIDEGNEQRARTDYPKIMNKAHHVLSYYLDGTSVNLFRIAGHTNNTIASNYTLSKFEKLVLVNETNDSALFQQSAEKFLLEHPHNISAHLLIATNALKYNDFKQVEASILNAIEFSPTNYTLLSVLARFYRDLYKINKIKIYRSNALKYYDKALWFYPTSELLLKEKSALLSS